MTPDTIRTIESSRILALANDFPVLQGVNITTSDYKGRVYSDFYAAKDYIGRGFVVLGKNEDYGGRMRMTVAHNGYNRRNGLKRGWTTKRAAMVIANALNGVR